MATFVLADPHAFGIVAVGAEGRRAGRTDPFVAALVPALLLVQALAQRIHQRVEAAQRLDLRPFLWRQVLFGHPAQPFVGQNPGGGAAGLRRRRSLQPAEYLAENQVEPVKMPLVLHQGGAGQEVEVFDAVIGNAGPHRAQQGQVFGDRGRYPRVAQGEDEGGEHATRRGASERPGVRINARLVRFSAVRHAAAV